MSNNRRQLALARNHFSVLSSPHQAAATRESLRPPRQNGPPLVAVVAPGKLCKPEGSTDGWSRPSTSSSGRPRIELSSFGRPSRMVEGVGSVTGVVSTVPRRFKGLMSPRPKSSPYGGSLGVTQEGFLGFHPGDFELKRS